MIWEYAYDGADQLVRALKRATDPQGTILQRFAYGYDPAGNRLFEQVDDTVTAWTYDRLNRLVTQTAGGMLRVAGTVNEPARVTVDGLPAAVDASGVFVGAVAVQPGTTRFTVRATDASGNVTAQPYDIDQLGAPKTFTFDANGNLTGDVTRTFEWDARNQLVALTIGTSRVEFAYDGAGQRLRRVERQGGNVVVEIAWVRCDWEVCEKRSGDGATVLARVFRRGEHAAGSARFFAKDHLDSVRSEADAVGMAIGRYDYDPWGRRTVTAGIESAPSYAALETEPVGGLSLGQFRWYDPELGRWGSEDPSGAVDGPNLFMYVRGRPTTYIDPAGLQSVKTTDPKVERTPKLPQGCPPDACGCMLASVDIDCKCVDKGWMLSATYTATIYINTKKWTPEWMIDRHERGHVSDDLELLREMVSKARGPYPSEPACQAAGEALKNNFKKQSDGKARQRDFFVKRLCW